MGIFDVLGRRRAAVDSGASVSQALEQRLGLPHRFEAVGEALASGSDPIPACSVVGQDLARDGASLQEALVSLRATWQAVRGCDPSFEDVSAFLLAWSETTLGYLHQLSCEDALTGLASQAHLRSRLSELYRASVETELNHTHALVLCEVPDGHPSEEAGDNFTRAMRLTRLGENARTVFARGETIARLGTTRVAIVAERDDRLGRRVRLLRTLLERVDADRRTSRVWIEGLPGTDSSAALLLDELARR